MDLSLVGGKALRLGRLIREGFRVPPGICVTTRAYQAVVAPLTAGLPGLTSRTFEGARSIPRASLEVARCRIESASLPQCLIDELDQWLHKVQPQLLAPVETLWAVRSSATTEDNPDASFAGVYRTKLGVAGTHIAEALRECWASLWTTSALAYLRRVRAISTGPAVPQMAVIVQPLLRASAAGVAYSQHPVTGKQNVVAVDAVFGLGEPLVSGLVGPDHVLVAVGSDGDPGKVTRRATAEKAVQQCVISGSGLPRVADQAVPAERRLVPVLTDDEALAVSRAVKQVEKSFKKPVDVEWAIDPEGLWLVQARPIVRSGGSGALTDHLCTWSRANFKETLPDLPSPLALHYLRENTETIMLAQYHQIGCQVPSGLSPVRVLHGRPYLNITLFQLLVAQLGGDPDMVAEQIGGEGQPGPAHAQRLPWWRLMKAGVALQWRIWRAGRRAPSRFAMLKRIGESQLALRRESTTERDLVDRMAHLNRTFQDCDLTFAITSAVGQSLYFLGLLLKRRIPTGWRPLLNTSTRGLGGIISANQILWLIKAAEKAESNPTVRELLSADPWEPESVLASVTGSRFQASLDAYLKEFGHRAVGESDVMSPRFSEKPEYVLTIIRSHLKAGRIRSPEEITGEQERVRDAALREIRRGFTWRLHEWIMFFLCHRYLSRYVELREANRHALMHYVTALRHLLLLLGQKLVGRSLVISQEDVFFLTEPEIRSMLHDPNRDWRGLVQLRRADRARHAGDTPPDLIHPTYWAEELAASEGRGESGLAVDGALTGIPISAGYAEGPARMIRSPGEEDRVRSGDILVVPVVDPGWAPLLGLAAGLVVEMGGTLSHGAIIAREYGVPALVNVRQAMSLLQDGERIAIDATEGRLRRLDLEKGTSHHG